MGQVVHRAAGTAVRSPLAALLQQHMAERGVTQARLAELAELSKATLNRWLNGKSDHPYHRAGVLSLAAALGLSKVETNRLLRAAGLPPLDALVASADPAERALLTRWAAPVRNNLPADLTSFVGRAEEVAAVAELLCREGLRLLTLTGPGGSGKTRLALRVACETLDVFPDGVFFVPLGAVADPDLLLTSIAERVGLRDVLDATLPARLAGWLRGRRVLLLLDNLEQLLEGGPAIARLLRAAPGLTVLATSRVPLHLTGEHEWPVLPFPLPEPGQPPVDLRTNAAVELFVQRAQAANPRRLLDDDDLPAVAEICSRLDGLPLAIELAAAGTRQREPWRLLADFPSRLDLATGGPVDLPARQQTLRGTIAWSLQLLPPPARDLLARLAVFAGSWDAADAATVCACESMPVVAVEDIVRTLLDANLIQPAAVLSDAPRYHLLETIREDGLERLAARGEAAGLRERHARHMLALAESAPPYVPEVRLGDWYSRVDAALDDVRAALDWCAGRADPEPLVRLSAALWPYWHEYMHVEEGRRWLERALTRAVESPPRRKAALLTGDCMLAFRQTDFHIAFDHAHAALALWRQLGDHRGQALVLQQLGWGAFMMGGSAQATDLFAGEVEQWRLIEEAQGLARGLSDLAAAYYMSGDLTGAMPFLRETVTLLHDAQDEMGLARSASDRGLHALLREDLAEAIPLLREAVDRFRSAGRHYQLGTTVFYLGTALCFAGQLDDAVACYSEALRLHEEVADRVGLSLTLLGFAAVAHRRGDGTRAATLCGASRALQHAHHITLPPAVQALYQREVGLVVELIGCDAFEEAFALGGELTAEEAIALVRGATASL
ncbi:MAG TPA: helix-turn-helix domain-containing protein [Thermomicrobiaceae bacterium]|nr:helix-turn-helix domain-containing protein [Thermomicrobiaceae bacterium]